MYDDLAEVDLHIALFLGNSIEIPNIGKLYCLTNNEIREIGFSKYNQYLCLLCMDGDSIKKLFPNAQTDTEITTFDYLLSGSYHDVQFKEFAEAALSVFFKENIRFCPSILSFIVGDPKEQRAISKSKYEPIKFILKKQNGIKTEEPEKYANPIAKQMAEKLKRMREKYSKSANTNVEQEYDYSDILSSVCAKHPSINPLTIGELTIYSTLDQFKRLNMIDKYEIDIQSLLHGAKQEEVKLENWFNKA